MTYAMTYTMTIDLSDDPDGTPNRLIINRKSPCGVRCVQMKTGERPETDDDVIALKGGA